MKLDVGTDRGYVCPGSGRGGRAGSPLVLLSLSLALQGHERFRAVEDVYV